MPIDKAIEPLLQINEPYAINIESTANNVNLDFHTFFIVFY